MRALCCAVAALVCLMLLASPRSDRADDQGKKLLVGRWAFAPEKKPDAANASGAKAKASAKKPAARKVAEELPKCVIEFTKEGAVRLDGEPSALGPNFRFVKPLADVPIRVSPETRNIKISYEFKDDRSISVSADYS